MLENELNKKVLLLDKKFDKSTDWVHCPRCINGNMYLEYDDEHVCLQCGYRQYVGTSRNTSELLKIA